MKIVSIIPAFFTAFLSVNFLKKIFGNKAAILFLLSFIASQRIIHFSIEIRMYSWALFFITSVGISAWHVITTNKVKWYILFTVCALGAAYTQYYAAVAAGIGYLFLLIYTIKHKKKQIFPILLIAASALLLYSPWLLTVIKHFGQVSADYWIKSFKFKFLLGWIYDIFSAGNPVSTSILFLLFCSVFLFFVLRKNKNFNDYFCFCSFCCIIALTLFGIITAIAIKPLFISRYLVPLCALMWIFFSAQAGFIKNKYITILLFLVLSLLSIGTGVHFIVSETRENNDFNIFIQQSKQIKQDDIIVIIPSDDSVVGLISYLFPNNVKAIAAEYNNIKDKKNFNITSVPYNALAAIDSKKWFIFSPDKNNNINTDVFAKNFNLPDIEKNFCGDFGWGGYKFKLYYQD